jgi:elongation factor Ts
VSSAEQLLALASPSKQGMTLAEQLAELYNRIREKFEVGRFHRFDGPCGGYSHNSGTVAGVLVSIQGGNDAVAKDIAMHIAAMRPAALSVAQLDPAIVEKERGLLREQALAEGKPANIVDKMVDGRLKVFFAERVLLEQPFVKDDKQSVGAYAKANGMEVKDFVCMILGEGATTT